MQTDKHRDMARSILPSVEGPAIRRGLDATRRRHRRAVRADVRGLRTADHDDTTLDVRRTADRDVNRLRRRRQQADKLNHLERWAVAVTEHMPIEDRLGWLRAHLPDGLIGDHAMSHLRWIEELDPHARHWPTKRERDESARRWREAERSRLAADIRRTLDRPGGHRAINRALRSVEGEDDPPGPRLAGLHDVDALVDVLLPNGPPPRYHRREVPHPALVAVQRAVRSPGG